jgi:hypothetical protein
MSDVRVFVLRPRPSKAEDFSMRISDFSQLRGQIVRLARTSPVGDRIKGVEVEPGEDDTGGEFLRIVVQVRDLEDLKTEDVEPLVESIEDFVAQRDERFASVRFADAA